MRTKTTNEQLNIDLYWDEDCLPGVAFSVVDLLQMINQLRAMRAEPGVPAIIWRWRPMREHGVIPRWLPSGPNYKAKVADAVIVPGWHVQSGPQLDHVVQQCAGVIPALKKVHESGGQLAFIYTATALGARAGFFDGFSAAVPWPFFPATLRQSDRMQMAVDANWVSNNNIWSCNSPAWLTQMLLGMLGHNLKNGMADFSNAVANVLLPSQARLTVAHKTQEGMNGKILTEGVVQRACRWLEANIDNPYDLNRMAEAVHTSPRTLLRHFIQANDCTPLVYLQRLRVERARILLETSYISIEQISKMCGFSAPGTFRRVFMKSLGKLPSVYRENHRLRTSRKRWRGGVVES